MTESKFPLKIALIYGGLCGAFSGLLILVLASSLDDDAYQRGYQAGVAEKCGHESRIEKAAKWWAK